MGFFFRRLGLAFVLSMVSFWGVTQWLAWAYSYHPSLGDGLYTGSYYRLYWPWEGLHWVSTWGFAPQLNVFDGAFFVYLIVFVLSLSVFIASMRGQRKRLSQSESSNVHGSARWATRQDLKDANLLSCHGVVLAQTHDAQYKVKRSKWGESSNQLVMKRHGSDVLQHNGPEHVFCFAPTRSGKGVGLVIPSLLEWRGSAVIYDIKKELWSITSGWRRTFSHCLCFDPTSLESVRFNPLLEVRMGVNEVRDVQNIADILVDPQGVKDVLNHWDSAAHSLLVCAILHVLYAEKDKTLCGVANFLSNPSMPIRTILAQIKGTAHENKSIVSLATEMLNKSENELSGVVSTAMGFLSLYRDPVIASNTASSDFSILDLKEGRHPLSLYIVVPPSDIDRTKPLVRMLLNQIGRRLTETLDYPSSNGQGNEAKPTFKQKLLSTPFAMKVRRRNLSAYQQWKVAEHLKPKPSNHRVLMLLDEFPSLGKLGFLDSTLPYLAGYGIKCFFIAQSLSQLDQIYGVNNALLDNFHIRVTYGALNERTAQRISSMLGQKTVVKKRSSYSGRRSSLSLSHVSQSEYDVGRALLTPDEVMRLPEDEVLVLAGNYPPYRGKKIRYFLDKRFKKRGSLQPSNTRVEQLERVPQRTPSAWEGLAPIKTPDIEAVSEVEDLADQRDEDMSKTRQLGSERSKAIECEESERRALKSAKEHGREISANGEGQSIGGIPL